MAAKKRRIRSPHPGVVLKQRLLPSGARGWRARFTDPDTGRETYVKLDLTALPTQEARKLWAVRKSKELAKRAMEIEAGGARVRAKALQEAVSEYEQNAEHRLRAKTLETYGLAFERLRQWAKREGVEKTADLTHARLASLRDYLISAPRREVKRGGRHAERHDGNRKRGPVTVNRELRSLKTLFHSWRQAGLTRLSSDDITDTMKALPTPREQPEYLTPAQLQKLLEAAMRHDEAVFDETREEHRGLRPRGTTRRYEPIAAFAAFLVLTGCRRGEALGLTWADVDLEALDSQGRTVGEIRLRAANTKTHRARTIGLEVSPTLRALLAAMKLRAGRDADSLHVCGGAEPYTVDLVETARARLVAEYGAPKFDWQMLRSTCATYLTNAPGIFHSATVFMSASQLGHSVAIAERHYLGVHRGIPKDAHTLEAAMQIEARMLELLGRISGQTGRTGPIQRSLRSAEPYAATRERPDP
jgi:integrase